jgi:hypothetical protein
MIVWEYDSMVMGIIRRNPSQYGGPFYLLDNPVLGTTYANLPPLDEVLLRIKNGNSVRANSY